MWTTHQFKTDRIFNLFAYKCKQIINMKDILLSVFMVSHRILQPILYRPAFLLIIKLQKSSRIFLETDEWPRWRNKLNQAKYHTNLSWTKQAGENQKEKIVFRWLAIATKELTFTPKLTCWGSKVKHYYQKTFCSTIKSK